MFLPASAERRDKRRDDQWEDDEGEQDVRDKDRKIKALTIPGAVKWVDFSPTCAW
jgi:hypothetical protein